MRRRRAPAPLRTSPLELLDEVLVVERLAAGGRGVGRLKDGRVAFVPRALPGDQVRVRSCQAKKSFVEAVDVRIVEPSPARIVPVCGDAERCGGCDLMALPIAQQRAVKLTLLKEALERVGGVERGWLDANAAITGHEALGYRSRIRLQIAGKKLGFHAPGSRDLIEVDRCHVCSPELWTAALVLRRVLSEAPAYDWLISAEVGCAAGEKRPSAHLLVAASATAHAREELKARLAPHFQVAISEERDGASKSVGAVGPESPPEKPAFVRYPLGEQLYTLVPIGGFVQASATVNSTLVQTVLGVAKRIFAQSALDVFCGSGNFTLPLLAAGVAAVGVELEGGAIAGARAAAMAQGLRGEFRAGPADRVLARFARAERRFDLVVVDPPRAGARGIEDSLARLASHTLLMISCDPVTLARDVSRLAAAGFSLVSAQALDMFPQTHHVEAVVELRAPLSLRSHAV